MRTSRYPVAVCASDLHLSKRPPLFRSVEDDWVEVQKKYLKQLNKLCSVSQLDFTAISHLPFLTAGDLFDQFGKDPHEIVNLAIKYLPEKVYAVCGNHDLLHHFKDDLHKTAYGVLVEAKRITDVKPEDPVIIEGGRMPIRLHGFPYVADIHPLKDPNDLYLEVALIHSYIWTSSTGYVGAPEDQRLTKSYRSTLSGYDFVLFGDNHKTIEYNLDKSKEGPSIFNPGGFSIRKSDELEHKPCVGILYSDGTVEKKYLDISKDNYLKPEDVISTTSSIGVSGFIEELLELGEQALDFSAFLKKMMERRKVPQEVRDWITKALDQES